jgi:hypothetical protein
MKENKKKRKLKVLQIHNIAGVAGSLSTMIDKLPNMKSTVITRKNQDYYGINDHYKEYTNFKIVGGERAVWFYLYVILYILIKKPNVIHIHAWLKGLKMVLFLKKFYIRKPYIIFNGHGSEIRFKGADVYDLLRMPDKVIVSTKDLSEELEKVIKDDILINKENIPPIDLKYYKKMNLEWVSNPIDSDLFYPPGNSEKSKGKVLYIRNFLPVVYPYDYMDKVQEFVEIHNLKLSIIDRMSDHDNKTLPIPRALTFGDFIPFKEIGDIFRQNEYFLDFKGVEPIFSKAGIEAGKCGCKIVHESFKIYEPNELEKLDGFPRFQAIYLEVQEKWKS